MRCINVLTASTSNKCETNLVGVINKMIANDETMGARKYYPFVVVFDAVAANKKIPIYSYIHLL